MSRAASTASSAGADPHASPHGPATPSSLAGPRALRMDQGLVAGTAAAAKQAGHFMQVWFVGVGVWG